MRIEPLGVALPGAMYFFLACSSPPPPVEEVKAAPVPVERAVPLPVDVTVDARVRELMQGADRFTSDQAGEAWRAIGDLGTGALPELLRMTRESSDPRAHHAICAAIATLDVRDSRATEILLPLVDGPDATVSACGRAAARTLEVGAPEVRTVVDWTRDGRRACFVRKSIASALREPSLCGEVLARTGNSGCSGEVAIRAAGSCEGASKHLLGLAMHGETTTSEAALAALLEQQVIDGRELDPLRHRLKTGPLDNAAALMIDLVGKHGTQRDIALLQMVERRDPHGPDGFHASRARKARSLL